MLETLLKLNTGASLSGCVRWTQPMDGVHVCDFDCALTVPPALPAEPSEVPCEVLFCRQRVTVNVDHHISNTRYAKYNYVAGEASNCENVHGLLGLLNAVLTPEIANALLLGISTDTGNFNHKNVTEHTLKTAAAGTCSPAAA